jgi:hypothetical protein
VTVVSRTVAAIPARTSVGTWKAITDLLAPAGSAGRARMEAVTNIAAVLITAEYTRQAPIVVIPASGPRIRIRTAHGPDAADARAAEIPLVASPCAEPGWIMSLPCGVDDIEEIRAALSQYPGIEARDVTDGITTGEPGADTAGGEWSIDYDELERP